MKAFSKKKGVSFIVAVLLITSAAGQHMHMKEAGTGAGNVFLLMMDTMMNNMADVPKKNYASEVFISTMIPHHQGAISMASYEIRHGSNFTMLQLAKSILAEQQIEVQQMQLWLEDPVPDTVKTNSCFQKEMDLSMTVMMQNMPVGKIPNNTDRAFARIMIPHHQAAIDMARAVIQNGADGRTASFAKRIIASQEIEIEQMLLFLNHK